ncbi:hypothetical protein ACFU7Y_42385 [Kitasatospora sp. NPDC057542]|uniref:hypothetical protein n=1 Tax=Kitasatospora sp. NPDC057542 TaxID=3346162 RepID=UPI0036AD48DF
MTTPSSRRPLYRRDTDPDRVPESAPRIRRLAAELIEPTPDAGPGRPPEAVAVPGRRRLAVPVPARASEDLPQPGQAPTTSSGGTAS